MELRVSQYFLAVAREQSISAAAQSLHLSQPTLSTQLKAMEAELGKQLLIRGARGSRKVTLTEEGMILRKRAEEILQLVKKAEDEITLSDEAIAGNVFIGAGETEGVRYLIQAQHALQQKYPLVYFHIQSGDRKDILDSLDQGLSDFGLILGEVDTAKYDCLDIPCRNTWGVLMRRDSPLAEKAAVEPEDLWNKPLILSRQECYAGALLPWLKQEWGQINKVATYSLLFNASLMVEEGLGYAVGLDQIINTSGESKLCFRPLRPRIEMGTHVVWKKYQMFSKAAEQYLAFLKKASQG